MRQEAKIKSEEFQSCIIVPFTFEPSYFSDMKKDDGSEKHNGLFESAFYKVPVKVKDVFNSTGEELLTEASGKKEILQRYRLTDTERRKIGLNQSESFWYTLQKQGYKMQIGKIDAWFFCRGQGFLTVKIKSQTNTVEQALDFNKIRWFRKQSRFFGEKKISKEKSRTLMVDMNVICKACFDSMEKISARGILDDTKTFQLSLLLVDDIKEADSEEILERICLQYTLDCPVAEAQKTMEFVWPYDYICWAAYENCVAVVGDCYKEKQRENSNCVFMKATFPGNIFSHYLIAYLYYLFQYKQCEQLEMMLALEDKITEEMMQKAFLHMNGEIREVANSRYNVLNELFCNTLCGKVWRLQERFKKLKQYEKQRLLGDIEYDVFLSYRHDGGQYLALLLYEHLQRKGFRVFWDAESLRAGHFEEQIYEVLRKCKNVIAILSPGSIEKMLEEDDWVAKELREAFRLRNKVLLVTMENVEFPGKKEETILPDDLKELVKCQGIESNVALFEAVINRICKSL